ncbi:Protein GRAVITROPIC IN THE LIGHT 1 [Turnera subulata]|uniref:Protein GRAVITROPIC IN THE LIGHT 1 n=1 Tax=Turnera subulata TaxID=218843 RepID=A0A9Q0GHJ8_9ROSI|nr:Protein GRAVITROPIC IN THE LIGHT 1 [Turnera subulata]
MANKVTSNFSDLIQRVAASCLLHPLAAPGRHKAEPQELYEYETETEAEAEAEESAEEDQVNGHLLYGGGGGSSSSSKGERMAMERVVEMEMLMNEVFDSVSAMKRAYGSLQEAHCPWDPERMRVADAAVVGELRRLAVLRERFRRCVSVGGGGAGMTMMMMRGDSIEKGMLREVVAPYEAAVEELKREVKARETEVHNLKEKLKSSSSSSGGGRGKKGWSQSKRKVSCSSAAQVAGSPSPELFEITMSQVKSTSKSFTSLLLTLMRTAHWDIAAAVRSIEAATTAADNITTTAIASTLATHHAKYALESYISRKFFQGFDHETFYMDGSLSSLLNPDQFRRDCFTQYRDMKAMDPCELLGILPTCHFGKFCSKKYLAIVHPKMEESLFGNTEQRQQVLAGNHPRTQFYAEFLGLAKAVWLLHLLAFSLDPAPSQFEASRGAEYHAQYMESAVRFSSGRIPAGQIVGFPVSPGFRLGNGSVVKARVYLVPRK